MGNTLIWIPKRLVELDLLNIAALSAQAFVDYCEEDYRTRIRDAAQSVLNSGAKVVMLTGPSSSGKTTTAHKLAQQIREQGVHAAVVSLDNFFKDIEEYPLLPDGSPDYESVDALDVQEINRCLLELTRTGCTQIPDFDFCREQRRMGRIPVQIGQGIAVVEGIHALNPRLTALLPRGSVYKIYAGLREEYSSGGQRSLPTRDVRLARRIVRDYQFRGHSVEKTLSMWPAVCEGEDKNIKVFKPEADLLLDTSFSYEACCLAPLICEHRNALSPQSPYAQRLENLCDVFQRCHTIPLSYVPKDSMLREFLGDAQ
ncbi:uridine kinase [uncultured Ruthenibacterium sp.]|uniref:uridine kinase family protein n=1 Tax=uncultured Ruthenibacterium sp. TaxID=1905347 RepID=UPI00349ED87D